MLVVLVLILLSLLCLATISFVFLDVWFLFRNLVIYFKAKWEGPQINVLDESVMYSRVLPADLDYMGHMNNARYAREADIGRYMYMFRCWLLQTIWGKNCTTFLTATSWRFRRSLKLWERFAIRTRMLGWDDHAFYLEQQFISCRDKFVCAIVLVRHHMNGMSPSESLQSLYGKQVESPEIPEDIHCWMNSNQINRERLMNEVKNNDKSK